jgi:excisionase family DNA binding protein
MSPTKPTSNKSSDEHRPSRKHRRTAPVKKRGRTQKRPARIDPSQANASLPVLCSITRTARLLDLGRTTVKKLIASGQLRSISVGRRRLVRYTDIVRFSEEQPNLGRVNVSVNGGAAPVPVPEQLEAR